MRSNLKWIIVFALFCVVCASVWLFRLNGKDGDTVAVIKLGDREVQTIDLSEISKPYEFVVYDDNGGSNTIRAEKGRIAVIEADCPDKVCVKQGYIENGAVPIVCLPHKLSVIIEKKNANAPDAVVNGMGSVKGELN